jgi:hypothetical protein
MLSEMEDGYTGGDPSDIWAEEAPITSKASVTQPKEQFIQQQITAKLATVIKDSARKWLPKEQVKSRMATQYIGDGAPDSSTARYKKLYESYGIANTGKYAANDIVWVSSNGKRMNRVNPIENGVLQGVYKNINKAIAAEAAIVMDTHAHIEATKSYNIGEVALAEYMNANGYSRDKQGVWRLDAVRIEELNERALSALKAGDADVVDGPPDPDPTEEEFEQMRYNREGPSGEQLLAMAEDGNTGGDPSDMYAWQEQEYRAEEASKREEKIKDRVRIQGDTVNEINKVSAENKASMDATIADLTENFEKYFPAYVDFNTEERAAFIRMMGEGQIEISC